MSALNVIPAGRHYAGVAGSSSWVVTPMLTKGLPVDLPKVNNPEKMPDADKDDAILVGISASGDVYLGTTKSDISQIADKVRDLISGKLDKTVYIKADGRAKYGDVVKVVTLLKFVPRMWINTVGLETEKTGPEISFARASSTGRVASAGKRSVGPPLPSYGYGNSSAPVEFMRGAELRSTEKRLWEWM